ncbi:MAG: DUF2157 domain-containing protein [Pseudomonadota bacterium]
MHDLSEELQTLSPDSPAEAARLAAIRLESRAVFSVRPELLVALYIAIATLVAGVGLLVKSNLDRIGPVALLTGIFAASALCYAVALRAQRAGRDRSLGLDYVLLLGALLLSVAVGYAELQFHFLRSNWSRHLLLLAAWHLATAYLLRSRLLLSVALTAFAGWLGVEARLGTLFNPLYPLLGSGLRCLLCALLFYLGSRFHLNEHSDARNGFREVYRQFAVNFGFFGALALGAQPSTRWVGAAILLGLAVIVGRAGLRERRQSFLLYAVGYTTIGLVWLEALVLGSYVLTSWAGLATVIGAVMLLLSLRSRLKESAA